MDNPEGGLSMPGFADRLTEDERWALIDAIRANNAGVALGGGRGWPRPTLAPRFEAGCADGSQLDLADLKGLAARIVVIGGSAPPVPGLVTIVIGPEPAAGACADSDPATMAAYALVAGLTPEALSGSQFLVDPDGWLRALWRPGDPPGWTATASLPAEVAAIRRAPVHVTQGARHQHAP
jgi:hypothetical protein